MKRDANDGEPVVLDPGVVGDAVELGAAVDEVIRRDAVAGQRLREVNALGDILLQVVDPETWRLLLEVEFRSNERWADLLTVIARWAFEEGQRHPHPTGDDDLSGAR